MMRPACIVLVSMVAMAVTLDALNAMRLPLWPTIGAVLTCGVLWVYAMHLAIPVRVTR